MNGTKTSTQDPAVGNDGEVQEPVFVLGEDDGLLEASMATVQAYEGPQH